MGFPLTRIALVAVTAISLSTLARAGSDSSATAPLPVAGPIYVPNDSPVYDALHRLSAMGFIPDQDSDISPLTRQECLRQIDEARKEIKAHPGAGADEALQLVAELETELAGETPGGNILRVQSVYTRFMGIGGQPLTDSYHFGQTIFNDYGRPYGTGLNNITGFTAYATEGRFAAYMRGEYQTSGAVPSESLSVREFIAAADANPLQGPNGHGRINQFEPLEMYVSGRFGFENISFGQQSLWWGPDEMSAFSFSDNASPFYSMRFSQDRPWIFPGVLSHLGKIRTDIVAGKLSGHQWPPRPFVEAEKISLDLTDDFELGFTRSSFFGGVGHPLTLGSIERDLLSTASTGSGAYGSSSDPGDRHSGFDFRWRVAGLRRYVTAYSDSYADDDPNPIDNPKRSAWAPGLYISQIPGLRKLDFRFETYSTWLYRMDFGGAFIYYNDDYHDAYTNRGYLLGSWIGRDSRAYVARTTYQFNAKSNLSAQFRQIKAAPGFLPGGGTQTDASVNLRWIASDQIFFDGSAEYERYFIPILGGERRVLVSSFQFTFQPRKWAVRW